MQQDDTAHEDVPDTQDAAPAQEPSCSAESSDSACIPEEETAVSAEVLPEAEVTPAPLPEQPEIAADEPETAASEPEDLPEEEAAPEYEAAGEEVLPADPEEEEEEPSADPEEEEEEPSADPEEEEEKTVVLSEELSRIFARADDLISHETPEGVQIPEVPEEPDPFAFVLDEEEIDDSDIPYDPLMDDEPEIIPEKKRHTRKYADPMY